MRVRRVFAFLLSILSPGAGHFLLGAFRRGAAWAVGIAGLGLVMGWSMRLSVSALLLGFIALVIGHVASGIDAVRSSAARPRWLLVLLGWGALLALGVAESRLADHYMTSYVQAYTIRSGSMSDTLLAGDYVLVDKATYRTREPERGDLVVFRYSRDERRDFMKRVIGLPGETLQIRGRHVMIDGRALDEPYVRHDGRTPDGSCGYTYGCEPIVVPPDSYFVMGDNRDNSQDSRYWGFVRRDGIKGQISLVYWSWDPDRHQVRWWRLGHGLR